MNLARISATLATTIALGGLASAQFTTIGPFSGTAGTESFETQTHSGFQPCVQGRVFSDQADLCTPGASGASITSGWSFGCSIGPHSGNRFFGSAQGMAAYTFDECVTRFGGYFGNNTTSGVDGMAYFYDDAGTLLHSAVITVPNDCSWNWHGWDTGGLAVKTIEVPLNGYGGPFMMMDDMEADIVPCTGGPGSQYCPGDGVAPNTPCPCVNNNDGSMGGCDWGNVSFPSGGVLDASGSASIAAQNTYLNATAIEDNFGVFFGADNQVNSGYGNPLNDGLRCAGGGLIRLIPPTMASGNQATTPQPVQLLDAGAVAGATRRYQYWFRTPTGPCGQMANLTNGYEIMWVL